MAPVVACGGGGVAVVAVVGCLERRMRRQRVEWPMSPSSAVAAAPVW